MMSYSYYIESGVTEGSSVYLYSDYFYLELYGQITLYDDYDNQVFAPINDGTCQTTNQLFCLYTVEVYPGKKNADG